MNDLLLFLAEINDSGLVQALATILVLASPLMLAVVGETITERVGVINLSLDGTLMLTTMAGFVVAYRTRESLGIGGNTIPVLAGLAVAALLGALIALLVAFGNIRLKKDQVAIGFVLTLLLADTANFLGQRYTSTPGPRVTYMPIPVLKDIPFIGPIFFDHDLLIYAILATVGIVWWWMYRTQPGLQLRGVGERPESAFARGVAVNKYRYLYAAVGGALVGVAGAAYSLNVRLGWSDNHVLGYGWIALAIVIFGGWHPIRGALGALLFGMTGYLATTLQGQLREIPSMLFNTLQWLLMLMVLLMVGSNVSKRLVDAAPRAIQRPLARVLRVAPPQGLGRAFVEK